MHIEMYLPEVSPRAKLTVYRKTEDGWDGTSWEAATLEDVARAAGMDLGEMNDAYEQIAALGIPTFDMTSYTRDGEDTDDPAEAKSWQVFFRHPEASGMTSCAQGSTAGKALRKAAQMEADRQRQDLLAAAEHHERKAKRLREQLESMESYVKARET